MGRRIWQWRAAGAPATQALGVSIDNLYGRTPPDAFIERGHLKRKMGSRA